jgi:hypothetical protein
MQTCFDWTILQEIFVVDNKNLAETATTNENMVEAEDK